MWRRSDKTTASPRSLGPPVISGDITVFVGRYCFRAVALCGSRFIGDPDQSPMPRFGLAWAARLRRRSLHLGVSRGDLGAHPRCSDSPPRFVPERPLTRPVFLLAYGRSTCAELASRVDTKVSHNDTVSGTESRWGGGGCQSGPSRQSCWYDHSGSLSDFLAAVLPSRGRSSPARWVDRLASAMATATSQPSNRRCFVGSARTNLRDGKSLRCPPARRVPDKWSGRRPNKHMGRVSGLSFSNAEDCLSSEGGHRRLCASPLHVSGGPKKTRVLERGFLRFRHRRSG